MLIIMVFVFVLETTMKSFWFCAAQFRVSILHRWCAPSQWHRPTSTEQEPSVILPPFFVRQTCGSVPSVVGQIFPQAAAHTLTSSEARYTHRWATSSAVHILPVFCLAIKSLKALKGEGQEHLWASGPLAHASLQQNQYLFWVSLGLDSSSQWWSIDSTWKNNINSWSHLHLRLLVVLVLFSESYF